MTSSPSCALDVVRWLQAQGITPLPCSPKSKVPIWEISTRALYQDTKLEDSFHNPTQERCRVISRWWNNDEYLLQAGPGDLSISIDLSPGFNQGRGILGIDVDTDALTDVFMQNPILDTAPAVVGKKGVKLFCFINGENIPDILQYYGPYEHPLLEVFHQNKHLIVYGMHPDSTPANPITYRFIRGYGAPIPTLSWTDVQSVLEWISFTYKLTLEKTQKPERQSKPAKPTRPTYPQRMGLRLEEYCRPLDKNGNPLEIHEGMRIVQGTHPFHGSNSGVNLKVDLEQQIWYCHRCKIGGGIGHWLKVVKAHELGYPLHNLCRLAVLGAKP